MASSLPNNPYQQKACLPCLHNDGQSQTAQNKFLPTRDARKDGALKLTEEILASEMSKLTFQQRAEALDDVHCVGEELKETPEMVQKSLVNFEEAVQQQHRKYPIYAVAVNQNKAFVEDPAFRLKFLRFNSYDAGKSVRQMMSFLHFKAKYFGQDKVAREILLSDLTEEDNVLLLARNHIQKDRDRMGRVIVHDLDFMEVLRGYGTDVWIRSVYYFCWNILIGMEDVQMNGIVNISNIGMMKGFGFACLTEFLPFYNSLPLRIAALHLCVEKHSDGKNTGSIDGLFSFTMERLPQETRARSLIHVGTWMEIQYQLRGHGIPSDTFPIDMDGNLREHILNLWLEKHIQETNQIMDSSFHRRMAASLGPSQGTDIGLNLWNQSLSVGNDGALSETMLLQNDHQLSGQLWSSNQDNSVTNQESTASQGGSIVPTNADVLFGRGYRLQWHPGNVQYRNFLEQHREEYETTSRLKKRDIARRLEETLRSQGVRFLQKNGSGEWSESGVSEVETRVCQYFRELRKKDAKNRSRN